MMFGYDDCKHDWQQIQSNITTHTAMTEEIDGCPFRMHLVNRPTKVVRIED